MSREINQYADDTELVVFYQLLSAAPLLGAAMYHSELNEGFRAWLQDLFDAAPVREQRWLRTLFLYYGMYDGEPKTYAEVGQILDKSPATVRVRAARGLRYLWDLTGANPLDTKEGYEEALRVNEWPTSDTSDTSSLEFYLVLMDQDGQFPHTGLTPAAKPGAEDEHEHSRPNRNPANLKPVNLWTEGVETTPEVVLMKDGKLTAAGLERGLDAEPVAPSGFGWQALAPRQPRRPAGFSTR